MSDPNQSKWSGMKMSRGCLKDFGRDSSWRQGWKWNLSFWKIDFITELTFPSGFYNFRMALIEFKFLLRASSVVTFSWGQNGNGTWESLFAGNSISNFADVTIRLSDFPYCHSESWNPDHTFHFHCTDLIVNFKLKKQNGI